MYKRLLLIFIFPLVIFWPSITTFFTNDDFYFLNIVKNTSFAEFLNYFNIFTKNPDGLGVYRPLTSQVFYMLNNPVLMHTVTYITFFAILYLVYKLGIMLFKSEKIALISTFLYAVSATHFAHFYYLATYQELGMTLFVLLAIITHLNKKYYLSILFFVLALMSKETAVVTPFIIIICELYISNFKFQIKKYVPYFLVLFLYLMSHIYLYGMATGDTYVWNFSLRKIFNTIFWYLLWALNLPETLVDFIGPYFTVNQNLFKYWADTINPILWSFIAELIIIVILMIKAMRNKIIDLENKRVSLVTMAWFLFALVPVLFLPIHKFSFYLTLPLIGIVYRLGYLFDRSKIGNIWIYGFMAIWLGLSIMTINHSRNTSWITNGADISKNAYNYFKNNNFDTDISLVDTPKDKDLPWSPTAVVKNALSDKNFFLVNFAELADKINYNGKSGKQIESRQLLGY